MTVLFDFLKKKKNRFQSLLFLSSQISGTLSSGRICSETPTHAFILTNKDERIDINSVELNPRQRINRVGLNLNLPGRERRKSSRFRISSRNQGRTNKQTNRGSLGPRS